MAQTVIGIFSDRDKAKNAAEDLRSNGFMDADIDSSNESIASEGGSSVSHSEGDNLGDRIERFFSNLFDNNDESTRYTAAARSGFVVSVRAASSEDATRASRILDDAGAIDVDDVETGSGFEPRASGDINDRTALADNDRRSGNDNTRRSIPVVEESFDVGKREVDTGRVRVRSRIIERPVEQTVRLREERVDVERTPANRPATGDDFATGQEEEMEMKTTAEIPVVKKEARVVEEVRLKKNVREREETVKDKVRRKDVHIGDSDSDVNSDANNRG